MDELVLKLKEFFIRDKNVIFAILFGSYSQEKQCKSSDIDIAVYFDNPPEGMDFLYLTNTLSNLTGKDVDIVVLNNASVFLRHQVMKYGLSVIIKDSITYTRFREKTISDYDEYKYVSGMNVYDRQVSR